MPCPKNKTNTMQIQDDAVGLKRITEPLTVNVECLAKYPIGVIELSPGHRPGLFCFHHQPTGRLVKAKELSPNYKFNRWVLNLSHIFGGVGNFY